MFLCFYIFSMFFCTFLMSCFCCCLNTNVQNYKYDAFLMDKDSFPGQSECFVAVLLTSFDSY